MIGIGGSGRQRTMRITTIEHGLVISTASRRRFGLRPHETYSCSCIPLYHLFSRSNLLYTMEPNHLRLHRKGYEDDSTCAARLFPIHFDLNPTRSPQRSSSTGQEDSGLAFDFANFIQSAGNISAHWSMRCWEALVIRFRRPDRVV